MKKLFFSNILILVFAFKVVSQNGAALNFDGINDYVNLTNTNNVFNISSAHIKTVQFWFKNPSNQGQHVRIFSTGSANWATGFWFGYLANTQNLYLEISDGMGIGVTITATNSTRGDNVWHHATAVFNGSVSILYLDGIKQGTVNTSGEGAINSAGNVHIGNSYDNESLSYFKGDVDELRVWDRVLCQSEILGTMNYELTGSETGLVAYYKFNQGIAGGSNSSQNTLTDFTGNSNHGALNNFSLNGSASNWISPGGVVTGSVNPNTSFPILQINSSASVVCQGQSATLTAAGANTYTWLPFNTNGQTSIIAPTITTTYTINGLDVYGCRNTSIFTQAVKSCEPVGINKQTEDSQIVFYPNPFKNSFIVECKSGQSVMLEIYDVLGLRIFSEKLNLPKTEINLTAYASGIYLIIFSEGNKNYSKKIVKQ